MDETWKNNGYFWVKETPQAEAWVFDHDDGACSWSVYLAGRRLLADHSWLNWRYQENGNWKDADQSWWTLNRATAFCDLLLSGEISVRRVDHPEPRYEWYYFYFEPIKVVQQIIPGFKNNDLFLSFTSLWEFNHPTTYDHWRHIQQLRVETPVSELAGG